MHVKPDPWTLFPFALSRLIFPVILSRPRSGRVEGSSRVEGQFQHALRHGRFAPCSGRTGLEKPVLMRNLAKLSMGQTASLRERYCGYSHCHGGCDPPPTLPQGPPSFASLPNEA